MRHWLYDICLGWHWLVKHPKSFFFHCHVYFYLFPDIVVSITCSILCVVEGGFVDVSHHSEFHRILVKILKNNIICYAPS